MSTSTVEPEGPAVAAPSTRLSSPPTNNGDDTTTTKQARNNNKTPSASYLSKRKQTPTFMPKRPMNAYNWFVKATCGGTSSNVKIPLKVVATRWKALSDKERQVYDKQAQQDQARYRQELKECREQAKRKEKVYNFRERSPPLQSSSALVPLLELKVPSGSASSSKVPTSRKREKRSDMETPSHAQSAGRKKSRRNKTMTPETIQPGSSKKISQREEEKLLKQVRNDAKVVFDKEKDLVLASIPQSMKDLYGQIGFCKWNRGVAASLQPVLVMNPYDAPPEPVRALFLDKLETAKKEGRPLDDKLPLIVYWYGETKERSMYSLIPQRSWLSYEQGLTQGACLLPAKIEQKLDSGGVLLLAPAEHKKVHTRNEVEQDLAKEPSERKRGVVGFLEGYQTLDLEDVEQFLVEAEENVKQQKKVKARPTKKRSASCERKAHVRRSKSSNKKARRVSNADDDDAPAHDTLPPMSTSIPGERTPPEVHHLQPPKYTTVTPFVKGEAPTSTIMDDSDDGDDGDDIDSNSSAAQGDTKLAAIDSPEANASATVATIPKAPSLTRQDETEDDIDVDAAVELEDDDGDQCFDDDDEVQNDSSVLDAKLSPSPFVGLETIDRKQGNLNGMLRVALMAAVALVVSVLVVFSMRRSCEGDHHPLGSITDAAFLFGNYLCDTPMQPPETTFNRYHGVEFI